MAPAELSPSADGHAHLDGRQHAGITARPACCVPGRTAASTRDAMPQTDPAAPRPGAPALVMNGTTPTATSDVTTRHHELVLVVDDEESYRDALSIGLSQDCLLYTSDAADE